MSKPNLLGFRTSIGFYRNRKVRECRQNLGRLIRRKVPFCELTPTLFQVVMAYASENQIDGDFEGYSAQAWAEIFGSNHIEVTPSEAGLIKKEFQRTGLLDGDKIRSWSKFNREFAHYETLTKFRQRAGKLSAKRREMEARAALKNQKNGHVEGSQVAPNPAPNPEKFPSKTAPKSAQKDSPSKQVWLIDQALQSAPRGSKARKELLAQKEQLLSETTGVNLSPASSPARSSPAPERKRSQAEIEADQLVMARTTLSDYPEGLSKSMVVALVKAGHKLPPEVRSKFRTVIEEASNPVPE